MPRGAAGGDRRRSDGWRRGDLLLLAAFAAAYLAHQVLWPARHLPRLTGDVANYLAAARALAAGGSPFAVHGFDYPPLLAFLVLPLAPLDDLAARWVWFAVGQAALVVAAWATWRAAGGGREAALAVAATWALGGTAAVNLAIGQSTPLLVAAIAVALALLPRRPGAAAAWVGAAAALKLWPGLLLAAWLARPWRRGLVVGAAVTVLLVAGPIAWLAATERQPALPASSGYWAGTPAPLNASLPATVLRALDPPAPGEPLPLTWTSGDSTAALLPAPWKRRVAVGVGTLFVLVAGGALLAPFLRGGAAAPSVLAVAALASVAVVASPIGWYHYQLAHFPAIALLAAAYLAERRWRALAAFGALALLATHPEWLGFGRYAARHGWTAADPVWLYAATSLPTAAGIALVAWLAIEVRRRVRASPPLSPGRRAAPSAAPTPPPSPPSPLPAPPDRRPGA